MSFEGKIKAAEELDGESGQLYEESGDGISPVRQSQVTNPDAEAKEDDSVYKKLKEDGDKSIVGCVLAPKVDHVEPDDVGTSTKTEDWKDEMKPRHEDSNDEDNKKDEKASSKADCMPRGSMRDLMMWSFEWHEEKCKEKEKEDLEKINIFATTSSVDSGDLALSEEFSQTKDSTFEDNSFLDEDSDEEVPGKKIKREQIQSEDDESDNQVKEDTNFLDDEAEESSSEEY